MSATDSERILGCAHAATDSGWSCCNVFEVQWFWKFGQGKARLIGLTVAATADRRDAVHAARANTQQGILGLV
jgi:hypothetical protein